MGLGKRFMRRMVQSRPPLYISDVYFDCIGSYCLIAEAIHITLAAAVCETLDVSLALFVLVYLTISLAVSLAVSLLIRVACCVLLYINLVQFFARSKADEHVARSGPLSISICI